MSCQWHVQHNKDAEHLLYQSAAVHHGDVQEGLGCNDVKWWICEDGINTEPYGYTPREPTTLLEPGDICPWHVYEIYDDEEL